MCPQVPQEHGQTSAEGIGVGSFQRRTTLYIPSAMGGMQRGLDAASAWLP